MPVVCCIVSEGKTDAEAVTLASEFVQKVLAAVAAAKEEAEDGEESGDLATE